MSFITLQEAKDWLSITGAAQDALLTSLIETADELIIDHCDTDFTDKTVVNEIRDSRRSDTIITRHFPILSVQKVVVGCNVDGTGGVELTPDSYVVRDEMIVLRNGHTPQGRGLVRLDYHHGYATVPKRAKLAAKITVEAYYRQKTRGSVGISSKSKEGESISYRGSWDKASGLPTEAIGLLSEFRVIEFPVDEMATRNI